MSGWTERNRWRRGRWLVVDDESGAVLYNDQVVRRWDGMYVRKDQDEPIDPQWFITSENDPTNVPFIRPDEPSPPACKTRLAYQSDGPWAQSIGTMVIEESFVVFPETRSPVRPFPGYNLYVGSSVNSMEIGCSFIVFPDGGPFPPRN
jgi:hypothetical protein